ncbi:MAG: UDP-glucose 4-epimerase [Thermoleophilaceae bacterium]|nr:UDP-glucose 4-epimerase [Thermoleophilaceae bacterium]
MKIAITGGAGFIGSHLADRLIAEGHEVLVIDDFDTGRRDNLEDHAALTFVEGSITDADLVRDRFTDFGPDAVVHAAASYRDPEAWAKDMMVNAVGTANVVRATQAAGTERLVYLQTALCYGVRPLEQPITLQHPIRPDSSYAISKTAGEQVIAMSGLDFVSFRLANAYGPRNISGPLPTFFQRLTEGKPCFVMETRRDFVFVADLLDAVAPAVLDGWGHGFYHASSGSDYSIEELYRATLTALGRNPEEEVEVRPRTEDDVATILLDPSRIQQDFGWTPSTPLDAGVAAAIEWYRAHGVTQTYTHLKVPERA